MSLELLEEKGLEPDVITCSAAISACEKAKQTGKALELLGEMRQKGLGPECDHVQRSHQLMRESQAVGEGVGAP